jgi:hypothetical protein
MMKIAIVPERGYEALASDKKQAEATRPSVCIVYSDRGGSDMVSMVLRSVRRVVEMLVPSKRKDRPCSGLRTSEL